MGDDEEWAYLFQETLSNPLIDLYSLILLISNVINLKITKVLDVTNFPFSERKYGFGGLSIFDCLFSLLEITGDSGALTPATSIPANWSLPRFRSPARFIFGPCGLLILPSISLSSTIGPSAQLIPRLPSQPKLVVAQPPVTGATLFQTLWVANLAVNLSLLHFAPSATNSRAVGSFVNSGLVRNKQPELSFAHSGKKKN
ncbi:Uncharacterized protein Fot_55250 [Forsythia ovata]|uniref:Uncharacterized protein n=1 Tax=Forsythia ovata TaxID=205694 RepID=A0ABD1P765_9LAMI